MITAVDTIILIDIFGADKKHGRSSADALRQCMKEGAVCACEIVWVETATAFKSDRKFLKVMQDLSIDFSPINLETAIASSSIWRKYRSSCGTRKRVGADILIGAHALHQCDRLLTRDRGFYQKYLKPLSILDPTQP